MKIESNEHLNTVTNYNIVTIMAPGSFFNKGQTNSIEQAVNHGE